MIIRRFDSLLLFSLISLAGGAMARADVSITQESLGPDGQLFGGSISPKGMHMAVMAAKGSRYQVIMDGAAGPKIDGLLLNASGAPATFTGIWGNSPIPVLFSQDGSHWTYMAKQGDEYVVMLDGQELARGPISKNSGGLNLTLSTNGQHVFWTEIDAKNNYSIVVDGKHGPAMRSLPQLYVSPDGSHYAYAYNDRGSENSWAFVDGRQVNFFGDDLQYTARNMLVSTMPTKDGNVILSLNGKPEIKAAAFNQKWISDDGRQVALQIVPQRGAEAFLSVNGKTVPGTQGLTVEKVYFSRDGKHYAALCDTKTGARFMIIDGKKGDEYPTIAQQVGSQNTMHWRYVTWAANCGYFNDQEPPIPGFTPDSSKFVFVAGSNGRQFLVINEDESNPYGSTLNPVLSPVGNRVAAWAVTPDFHQHVLLDGKDSSYPQDARISDLTFSPQGTHYAFVQQGSKLFVDNVAQPGHLQGTYVFSADDKHLAYLVTGDESGVMVDGKLLKVPGMVGHIFFSPDGNHICWVCSENIPFVLHIDTKDNYELYVDGKAAMHYTDNAVQNGEGFDSLRPEFSADGTMTFIARMDGNVRRFHVKSDTDLAAVLAASPTAKVN